VRERRAGLEEVHETSEIVVGSNEVDEGQALGRRLTHQPSHTLVSLSKRDALLNQPLGDVDRDQVGIRGGCGGDVKVEL